MSCADQWLRRGTRWLCALAAAGGLGGAAPAASGVIVEGITGIEPPAPGYVGQWNGSSCVAVGPHWLVSAKHVGGAVGGSVLLKGSWYRVVEIVAHPTHDLQLLRVAEELPGYHAIATGVRYGDPCYLGGYGVTAGAAITNGYDWNGPRKETWGANVIEGTGPFLVVAFHAPSLEQSVPYEAAFGVNDSGAGIFVVSAGGQLQLAGVAISVTGYGKSLYGSAGYALTAERYLNWIMPLIEPGAPITSSVVAPRGATLSPGGPLAPLWTLVLSSIALGRRRFRGKTRA